MNMPVSKVLRILANGADPETGELLPRGSVVNKPDVIRLLFQLATELDSRKLKSRVKLTPAEKREANISSGRPPRSHFPWEDDELQKLTESWKEGKSVKQLTKDHERSVFAIIAQLERQKLLDTEEAEKQKRLNSTFKEVKSEKGI